MPQQSFTQWDFFPGDDPAATAEDLAQATSEYGQPFIDHWSDWDAFASEIGASGLLTDNEMFVVLPLVLALEGDHGGARRLVQQELDRVADSPDIYSQKYREFASKLAGRGFEVT